MGMGELDFDVLFTSAIATAASSAEFRTGSGFKIKVLITVKTVVFAPIPNASVRTTNRTNIGLFRRSEEHTSELQSLTNLVCRLLLEKKKTYDRTNKYHKQDET